MKKIMADDKIFQDSASPIQLMRIEQVEETPLHSHDFGELVVITGGNGIHFTRQHNWPISTGDAFVINRKQTHGYRDTKNLNLVNLLYKPEQLNLPVHDLQSLPGYLALFTLEPGWRTRHQFKSRLTLSAHHLTRVENYINNLEDELKACVPGFRPAAHAIFIQIIVYLSRCYAHAAAPTPRELYRLASAISFLENNYDKKIYLQKVAGIAHMSVRNFQRVFYDAMGATPIAYLIRQRILHAAELLNQKNLSITEIGFQVGFQDSNYFARQFRGIMGRSPREYRENL